MNTVIEEYIAPTPSNILKVLAEETQRELFCTTSSEEYAKIMSIAPAIQREIIRRRIRKGVNSTKITITQSYFSVIR